MSDLIKRQDAQMAVQDHYNKDHGFRSYEDGQRMLNRINALPSAQKTGHWIYKNGAMVSPWYSSYECSECGCLNGYFKYCPECGSRNRGGEE